MNDFHCLRPGEEIVEVVAGYMNSAAITKRGQVFMWGSCRSCIDLPSRDPTKPTLVDALCGTSIAAVALGECHCLFLTTDGLVLSCGLDSYVAWPVACLTTALTGAQVSQRPVGL
jgi:alpha-tubulin suppressor-like RCC1 family protein